MLHIIFLHQEGSSNPVGVRGGLDKIPFHPYFVLKDLVGLIAALAGLAMISGYFPYILGDPENFNQANPISTPLHIQPEWYYLFAYAILRSIPNKLGGVVALALSVLILYVLPATGTKYLRSAQFNPVGQ